MRKHAFDVLSQEKVENVRHVHHLAPAFLVLHLKYTRGQQGHITLLSNQEWLRWSNFGAFVQIKKK